jgi:4-hydroxy-tetrahydrodipicolinate reductase
LKQKRIGTVPGTHTVTYNSEVDANKEYCTIAKVALGAVITAEWIV